MEIPWFGPLVPLLAFAHYWYLPVIGTLVVFLVVIALFEDQSAGSRNNGN
jgi:hypothetical protein